MAKAKAGKEEFDGPGVTKTTGAASSLKEGETHHRYRVQFDISYKGTPGKKMDDSSITVPAMSLTVRQLLENHTRGKDNNVHVKQPLYFDVPIPTIEDITDVEEYRSMLKETLEKTDQWLKDHPNNPENKKDPESKKEEVQAVLKETEEEATE
jgi:hypothetical protein